MKAIGFLAFFLILFGGAFASGAPQTRAYFATYDIFEFPYCGDAVCDGDESCSLCPEDCGACTAPSISITSPSEGETVGGPNVQMDYSSVAGSNPIASYIMRIDSGDWAQNGLNTNFTFSGVLDGAHTLYAIATDTLDTNSNTASVNIIVGTPPADVNGGDSGDEDGGGDDGGGDVPPDTGGEIPGGGGGGGGGGSGGGSAKGSEGDKALLRELRPSDLNAGPVTFSLLAQHGIPTPQNFLIEAEVMRGTEQVYFESATISNLPMGKAQKVIFSKAWNPLAGGDYNFIATLFSSSKTIKFDVKSRTLKIQDEVKMQEGEIIKEGPAKNETVPSQNTNGSADQIAPLNPQIQAPNPPEKPSLQDTVIAGALLGVLVAAGILSFKRFNEKRGGRIEIKDNSGPQSLKQAIEAAKLANQKKTTVQGQIGMDPNNTNAKTPLAQGAKCQQINSLQIILLQCPRKIP